MICRDFERRLEPWLDGALPAGERAACDRHLAQCPRCRELMALAGGLDPGVWEVSEQPPDLAPEILSRTSGAACARVREWLVPLVDPSEDGPLPEAEHALVELHLETCADCRALRSELEVLREDLPRLAEIDPGPGFVEGVLARTSHGRAGSPGRLVGWWRRLRAATVPGPLLPRLVRRPRFAWEAAYVAVLLLTPLIASAGSPDAAAQAVARLGRAGGATVASAVRGVTEGTAERAGSVGAAAGTELRTFGTRFASSLQRAADERPAVPDHPDDPKEDTP